MLNQFFTACGESATSGISLRTVWEVDADDRYAAYGNDAADASRHVNPLGGIGLIAIRSISGRGEIRLRSGKQIEMGREQLLITEWNHLKFYRSAAEHWNFWWFEFTLMGPPEFPVHQIIDVPALEDDEKIFRETCQCLRQSSRRQLRLASASFTWMLHRWLAEYDGGSNQSPQREAIEDVIEKIRDDLSHPWTVREMARAAHMGERHFRKVFHDHTGQSPKRFLDEMRLATAMEMLRHGMGSVSTVAYHLGYSCPFHFSRAFRKRYGLPPSKVRAS